MASSSSNSHIDPDLQALLDWVPPHLMHSPEETPSEISSKPTFYNKQLSDSIVLKHIKLMPSLVNDISGIVDQKLKVFQQSPEVLWPFGQVLSAENLEDLTSSLLGKSIHNDFSLTSFYTKTTAAFCLRPASGLTFFPRLKTWHSIFDWSMCAAKRALGDGALSIVRRPANFDDYSIERIRRYVQEVWDGLGEETETLLRDVKEKFPEIAVWKFKSIPVGEEIVMQGIENEALADRPFRWTRCKSAHFSHPKKHGTLVPDVGPDANLTPWTIQPSVSAPSRTGTPEPKRRKRNHEDETHNSVRELASEYLQQAWVEAVHADATLIILNSGNHEYVAVRHRATQTLHVSELIQPYTCKNHGYGKLHIGIYIAAYNDAVDRLRKFKLNPPSSDNDNDGGEDQTHVDGGHAKGRGRNASRRVGNRMSERQLAQTVALLSKPNQLFVYLQFGVYDSPVPATFVRVTPLKSIKPKPSLPTSSTSSDEYMTLILSSELGEGATGVVHGGKLEMKTPNRQGALDVVAKLAFDDDQRESLKHEYSIYCLLASKDVKHVPTALGLFEDVEDCAMALVLTPAGNPIAEVGQLSTAMRQDFQAALAEIHQAGILHGDIRRPNLLINDSGDVSIIDFDRSQETSSSKELAREMSHLVDLLG